MTGIAIADNDKDFLTHLGKGIDVVTTCDDWIKAARPHACLIVREVCADYSNVEIRKFGKQLSINERKLAKDESVGLSLRAGGGAGPAGGAAKVGGSRSRSYKTTESKHLIIERALGFKDYAPKFPTKLEESMYEHVIEWLKKYQSDQSQVKIDVTDDIGNPVERFNKYAEELKKGLEKWDDVSNAISSYIATNKITHYIDSVTIGAKKIENKEAAQSRIQFDAEMKAKGGNYIDDGGEVKVKSEKGEKTRHIIGVGDLRTFADGGGDPNLGIAEVGITPISDLVQNADVKAILDRAIKDYHEQKRDAEDKEHSGLIGPVQISCSRGISKVCWCVDEKASIVRGTSDVSKSSEFYLKYKRNGVFYIYYSQADHEKARLAVKRHDESSKWQIIVAASKHLYNHRELKFEMENTLSNKTMSVTEWLNKNESAHLYVRDPKLIVPRQVKPKFYIQMNDVGSPAEYNISFLRKKGCDFRNRFLRFKCESTKRAGYLGRGELASVGGRDGRRYDESITSSFFAADSDPLSESRMLQDLSEILTFDSEHFDELVSEDYVFPDLDEDSN